MSRRSQVELNLGGSVTQPAPEPVARAIEDLFSRDGERRAGEQRHDVTTPQARVGSWARPRVRRSDGVETRATTVHLPIDLAEALDAIRIRTHRRLSDLLVEAAREKWAGGRTK
jgi:hypothetical protein